MKLNEQPRGILDLNTLFIASLAFKTLASIKKELEGTEMQVVEFCFFGPLMQTGVEPHDARIRFVTCTKGDTQPELLDGVELAIDLYEDSITVEPDEWERWLGSGPDMQGMTWEDAVKWCQGDWEDLTIVEEERKTIYVPGDLYYGRIAKS